MSAARAIPPDPNAVPDETPSEDMDAIATQQTLRMAEVRLALESSVAYRLARFADGHDAEYLRLRNVAKGMDANLATLYGYLDDYRESAARLASFARLDAREQWQVAYYQCRMPELRADITRLEGCQSQLYSDAAAHARKASEIRAMLSRQAETELAQLAATQEQGA